MSEKENEFIKTLKGLLLKALVGIVVLFTGTAVPFYYKTQAAIDRSNEKIQELKEMKADKTSYELTVEQINRQLIEIKQDIKDIKQGK